METHTWLFKISKREAPLNLPQSARDDMMNDDDDDDDNVASDDNDNDHQHQDNDCDHHNNSNDHEKDTIVRRLSPWACVRRNVWGCRSGPRHTQWARQRWSWSRFPSTHRWPWWSSWHWVAMSGLPSSEWSWSTRWSLLAQSAHTYTGRLQFSDQPLNQWTAAQNIPKCVYIYSTVCSHQHGSRQ